ncbi:MAG TPA: hypothetical protein VJ757_09375 [Pseudonocardiaceae bacterium]|nr:hypothetical protein [Pseudonocardiaceae bacterium]
MTHPTAQAAARPVPTRTLIPGPGLLRNRLGTSDPDQLKAAETDFTAVRLAGLLQRPLPGNYDLAHLRRFRKRIFGDVYPRPGSCARW